jgi:SAM-dependent methyltransferase
VSTAIWHDVEYGAYDADLGLWNELAGRADGPILEIGCGTGRVALHLARRGHRVVGLDSDAALIEALKARAGDLDLEAVVADARTFQFEQEFALAIAPMQVLQLLGSSEERVACLERVSACLRPGGRLVAAIIERMPEPDGAPPPLPDVREVEGWVYSSLSVEAAVGPGEIVIRRLRQTVSPAGELSEEPNEIRIQTFPAAQLEAEGAQVGLAARTRSRIAATDLHVGSVLVTLAKEA